MKSNSTDEVIAPQYTTLTPDKCWDDLVEKGYVFAHNPTALSHIDDPVGLAVRLFGKRPYRFQKTTIQFSNGGNRTSLPFTKHEGVLHNDCMQYGMPAQIQLMICERQAETGGDSFLTDVWPILESIRSNDQDLFQQLFTTVRRM